MSEFSPKLSFGIVSSRGFLMKLKAEYEAFDKDAISSVHAINCAMTSWHMCDWIFNEYFSEASSRERMKSRLLSIGISMPDYVDLAQFQSKVKEICPDLEYMHWVANGSKHCILRNAHRVGKTVKYEGDFAFNDFSRHDFDVDRFQIEKTDGSKVDFEISLLKTISFWDDFLEQLEPI